MSINENTTVAQDGAENNITNVTQEEVTPTVSDVVTTTEAPKVEDTTPEIKQVLDPADIAEVKANFESKNIINAEVLGVVRGGFRVAYKTVPIFVPYALFGVNKPDEEEAKQLVGTKVDVVIEDFQEHENALPTVVANRKTVIEREILSKLSVGAIIEGPVSSVATFGIFIDLGGVEGLVHISQLSHHHVKDTKSFAKKGDILKAKIIEVDAANKKVALSIKDITDSPWKGISEKFPDNSICKGTVRRLTEFGAYVEIAPGVDALVRNNELAWGIRVTKPSDYLKVGDQKDFFVVNSNEDKKSLSLSLRRVAGNPWNEYLTKFAVGNEVSGEVKKIHEKGALITIGDNEIDAFMPLGRFRRLNTPYSEGDKVTVVIAEISSETESVILSPLDSESRPFEKRERSEQGDRPQRSDRGDRDSRPRGGGGRGGDRDRRGANIPSDLAGSKAASEFSLGDLLSHAAKKKLDSIK